MAFFRTNRLLCYVKRPTAAVPVEWRTDLREVVRELVPGERDKLRSLREQYGDTKIAEVSLNSILGGMRGVTALICETSVLDPKEGIRFRGLSIPEVREKLPHQREGREPLPEGLFWLLMTGKVPSEAQAKAISDEWVVRSKLPAHVVNMLNSFPPTVHPMSQLSAAVTAMSSESVFAKAYSDGMRKDNYWECVYEDAMNLLAKLPGVAGIIYRNTFKDGQPAGSVEPGRDWSGNFCELLGFQDKEFAELLRLYLTIHSDHEGGNVSAHTTHLVGSALSDPYLSLAAGLNGLAGPLHGLANQEVLKWLMRMRERYGDKATESEVREYVWSTLKAGQVVPGYGHAVLRKTDPRYVCQREFAQRHLPDDPLFRLVSLVYEVAPTVLTELGKVQNPWPNVDAHSGVLLYHYGLTEMRYYTVLFGVSRALGVLAQLVWSRALGLPIERPKSISTEGLRKIVAKD